MLMKIALTRVSGTRKGITEYLLFVNFDDIRMVVFSQSFTDPVGVKRMSRQQGHGLCGYTLKLLVYACESCRYCLIFLVSHNDFSCQAKTWLLDNLQLPYIALSSQVTSDEIPGARPRMSLLTQFPVPRCSLHKNRFANNSSRAYHFISRDVLLDREPSALIMESSEVKNFGQSGVRGGVMLLEDRCAAGWNGAFGC